MWFSASSRLSTRAGRNRRERVKSPVQSRSGAKRWGEERERFLVIHGLCGGWLVATDQVQPEPAHCSSSNTSSRRTIRPSLILLVGRPLPRSTALGAPRQRGNLMSRTSRSQASWITSWIRLVAFVALATSACSSGSSSLTLSATATGEAADAGDLTDAGSGEAGINLCGQ